MITEYSQSSRRLGENFWQRLVTGSPFAPSGRRSLLHILIVSGALLWAVRLIQQGQLPTLAWLLGGAVFLALSYRWPMPAVFVLMVLSTGIFSFVDMNNLPYWQIAGGLRLNSLDLLLLGMFLLSVVKVNQRRGQPLFLTPFVFLGGMIILSSIIGLILGTSDIDSMINTIRPMFSYAFYFIIIASVSSRKGLHTLVGMVFLIMTISVGLQIVEAIRGERLISGLTTARYVAETVKIKIQEQRVPYLWNRATGYLYLGLFLALGAVFSGEKVKRHLPFVLLGTLGFMIALVRQWYVYIAVGTIILFALQTRRRVRTAFIVGLVIIGLLGLSAAFGFFSQTTYGRSFLSVWTQRVQQLMHYNEQPNYIGRILIWQKQVGHFLQSPLSGYGRGYRTMRSNDTGLVNTLLQYGLIGLTGIAILIISVFRQGYLLWRRLEPSVERGYVAGILGLFGGMVVGYSFSKDFFTGGGLTVGLLAGILDRIHFFTSQEG